MIAPMLWALLIVQPVPGATGISAGAPPQPEGDPATWVSPRDYPSAALREFREGVVQVRLAVDAQGGVSGCQIAESSGHADLDTAACEAMLRRATLRPARDGDGTAIAGEYTQRVRWQIPLQNHPYAGGVGALNGGVRVIRLHVAQDGSVDFCSVSNGAVAATDSMQRGLCSSIPAATIAQARALARTREQGIWMEFVAGSYQYDRDPAWPAVGAVPQDVIRVVDRPAPPARLQVGPARPQSPPATPQSPPARPQAPQDSP